MCTSPLLWCSKCGKWTQQILRGLADVCIPPTGRQGQHLKKLSESTHPKCKLTKLGNGFSVNPSFWSTRWHALATKSGHSNSRANACPVANTSLAVIDPPPPVGDRGGGFDDPEAFSFDQAAAEQESGEFELTTASSSSNGGANRRLRSKTKCS